MLQDLFPEDTGNSSGRLMTMIVLWKSKPSSSCFNLNLELLFDLVVLFLLITIWIFTVYS